MKSILFTNAKLKGQNGLQDIYITCLLYTSDAADD